MVCLSYSFHIQYPILRVCFSEYTSNFKISIRDSHGAIYFRALLEDSLGSWPDNGKAILKRVSTNGSGGGELLHIPTLMYMLKERSMM